MDSERYREGKRRTLLDAQAYIIMRNQNFDEKTLINARYSLEKEARKYGLLRELRAEEIL